MSKFILDSHATQYKKFADALEAARNAQILVYGTTKSWHCKLFDELEWALVYSWRLMSDGTKEAFNYKINHIREVLKKKSRKSSIYRAYTMCFLPEEAMLEFIDFVSTARIMAEICKLDEFEIATYDRANDMIKAYIQAQCLFDSSIYAREMEGYVRMGDYNYKLLFG